MPLNSSKFIAVWTTRYSGMALYFANSEAQSAGEIGGTMPITGCHSVIDRPDSVRRVMPPTTTIRKIITQQTKSHAATGPVCLSFAVLGAVPDRAFVAVETDNAHPLKFAYCAQRKIARVERQFVTQAAGYLSRAGLYSVPLTRC